MEWALGLVAMPLVMIAFALRSDRRSAPRDVDWDLEWQVAWKPHPANVWFRHQAEVLAEHTRRAGDPDGWVLKTDAFEEACGVPSLAGAEARLVLMDVSPRIAVQAARAGGRAAACATDVRRLAFRRETFAAVISHSTLDHFATEREIRLGLRELHDVLRPGGRLVVTLDNPENPVLAVRRVIHSLTGRVGGLIPFAMGRTLSRRALVDALESEGFAVIESAHVLHTPRIAALWLAEWAARRRMAHFARSLEVAFRVLERVLRRMPTRRWSAHFVVAVASPAEEGRARPRGECLQSGTRVRRAVREPVSRAPRHGPLILP